MAKLKITRATGDVSEYQITPAIEYAFEKHFNGSFHKIFREREMQSDVYWLAWESIRRSGEVVKPFGEEFLESLAKVEVTEDDPNG